MSTKELSSARSTPQFFLPTVAYVLLSERIVAGLTSGAVK